MTGKRNLRPYAEVFSKIEPCHAPLTHRAAPGCRKAARLTLTGSAILLLPACSGELSALAPAGPAAERVAELWQIMLWGALAILAGVMGVALYALRTKRREQRFSDRRVLVGWGLVFPTLVLSALMGFAFLRGEQLLSRTPEDAVFRAHGERWVWTFGYPGGERTTNILHVPAGREFAVAISSGDVIHSFWVPRLGGKTDAIPGKLNHLRLRADRPGIYRGQCSEYCGIGHAHMQFEVHAHAPADYPARLVAAASVVADPLPVLDQRLAPAGSVIGRWIDYLLEVVGIT